MSIIGYHGMSAYNAETNKLSEQMATEKLLQEKDAAAKEQAKLERQAELDALAKQEQANRNMIAQTQKGQVEHEQEMEEKRFRDPNKHMGPQILAKILNQPALLAAKNIGGMGNGGGFEQSFRQSLGGSFSGGGGYHYA